MSRRKPQIEPDTQLRQLYGQLERAESQVRRWCSEACFHPVLSRNPPPCAHPNELLCGLARNRVEGLRRLIAREEARVDGA